VTIMDTGSNSDIFILVKKNTVAFGTVFNSKYFLLEHFRVSTTSNIWACTHTHTHRITSNIRHIFYTFFPVKIGVS
jgi:hypothetical protein